MIDIFAFALTQNAQSSRPVDLKPEAQNSPHFTQNSPVDSDVCESDLFSARQFLIG